jgi:REP element-mobilizing transposase RayT
LTEKQLFLWRRPRWVDRCGLTALEVVTFVTARGNERRDIYRDEADRLQFLELVAAQSERFGLRPWCYVLMDNHFHLGLETTEPNLSRAMQWPNLSYSVWFNRRHRRSGHLFQGRFKAGRVEWGKWELELTRYVYSERNLERGKM